MRTDPVAVPVEQEEWAAGPAGRATGFQADSAAADGCWVGCRVGHKVDERGVRTVADEAEVPEAHKVAEANSAAGDMATVQAQALAEAMGDTVKLSGNPAASD